MTDDTINRARERRMRVMRALERELSAQRRGWDMGELAGSARYSWQQPSSHPTNIVALADAVLADLSDDLSLEGIDLPPWVQEVTVTLLGDLTTPDDLGGSTYMRIAVGNGPDPLAALAAACRKAQP